MKVTIALFLICLAFAGSAASAAEGREADLIEGVTSRYGSDETVWLNAGGNRFAALVQESLLKQVMGGVVLVHGIGGSPDDPEMLHLLRKGLAERGWTTLSLFAPVAEPDMDTKEYLEMESDYAGRLQAAREYLAGRQALPIAMLGSRAGAAMLIRYLAKNADAKVGAAVLIDVPDEFRQGVEKVKLPLLDIVAGSGKNLDEEALAKRKGSMKDNEHFQQVVIKDAGGDLRTLQELLLNRIHGWLKREMAPEAPGLDDR